MNATLVYVGIGSVLVTGLAILLVAVLLLRVGRRYVELAEERLELLREGQEMLVRISRREHQAAEERESAREPVHEAARPTVLEPARLAPRPVPARDRVEAAPAEEPAGDPRPQDPGRYVQEALGLGGKEPTVERGRRAPASASGGGRPRLGVKVPHPDDDVSLGGAGEAPAEAPARLFQKFYDRHLEHYEGYVRLAGRLHRTREEAEGDAGVPAAREWEDKLRRAHEAIERNAGRLDMLEEYYPELATDDDRISRRAAIARLHADIEKRFGAPASRHGASGERREPGGRP